MLRAGKISQSEPNANRPPETPFLLEKLAKSPLRTRICSMSPVTRSQPARVLFAAVLLIVSLGTERCLAGPKPAELVTAARTQIGVTVSYDAAYRDLTYPGGDVPKETGVCTDVVVRALREQGLDLQKEMHEDMK